MSQAARSPSARSTSADPRRPLIAKLHIAPKQLGIEKEDYREILRRVTAKDGKPGKSSAADMDMGELHLALAEFERLGFTASARPGAQRKAMPARAEHPSARKARALWISLYQLGVVRNPSETALEAFAARQLKCERMAWMRQSECYRLIEALKAMAERNGWAQRGLDGEALSVEQLQEGLCVTILGRLKAAGVAQQDMTVASAAFVFGGLRPGRDMLSWSRAAAGMGEWLRKAGLARPEGASS